MRRLLILVVMAAALWSGYRHYALRPLQQPPGVLVAQSPRQVNLEGVVTPIAHGDYALEPVARYELRARVLGRLAYTVGREAQVSPLDFALGWGPMSDSAVLERLSITQSSRFYYYRWQDEPPIPKEAIARHSANTHLIPATRSVDNALRRVRPGAVVALAGYLVNVSAGDGWRWKTSLTRTDQGAGACELFFVEQASVIQ